MQKIKITDDVLATKIRNYARAHKISFQKACARLFDTGVCHLQKKENNVIDCVGLSKSPLFCAGVCHLEHSFKITIEIEIS